MANEKRFSKNISGRGKFVIPQYTSFNSIVDGDSLEEAISKIDNDLENKNHDDLKNIYGPSGNKYHVAENIFNALGEYGGYTPGASNMIPTVQWVEQQITNANVRIAHGHVSNNGLVSLDAGIVSSGSYYGDDGFTDAHVIVAGRGFIVWSTEYDCWYSWEWESGFEGTRFRARSRSSVNAWGPAGYYWLAIQ